MFSGLNGLLMLLLTFYWLSLPYTFGDETFLIKWTSLVKKELLGWDKKPSPEDVLFIDIAANKTTIPGKDLFGESAYNRKVITDREQLTSLIRVMAPHEADIRLLVLDVIFEDSTKFDQALEAELAKLRGKVVAASHLQRNDSLIRPCIRVPYALATYRSTDDLFLKYPLVMKDSLKTLPLVMLEQLNKAVYKRWAGLNWVNKRLSLPAPLVDFKIRQSDFQEGRGLEQGHFNILDLGTVLSISEMSDDSLMAPYFRNKLIMVGDFEQDMHNTPFGTMAGILIIYNSYLTLADAGNIVSMIWILFLWGGFTVMSYRIFSKMQVVRPQWLSRIFQSKVGQVILNSLDEALILTVLTICSYFFFNIHINILVLLLYIKLVEYGWRLASARSSGGAGMEVST